MCEWIRIFSFRCITKQHKIHIFLCRGINIFYIISLEINTKFVNKKKSYAIFLYENKNIFHIMYLEISQIHNPRLTNNIYKDSQ